MSISPQMFQAMAAAFNSASEGGSGNSLDTDGLYYLKINSNEFKTHPQEGYPFFNTSFTVIQSNVPKYPANTVLDWNVWMKEQRYLQTYMKDVRRFIFNTVKGNLDANVRFDQIEFRHLQWVCEQPQQPFAGKYVAVEVRRKLKKGRGEYVDPNDPKNYFPNTYWRVWQGPGHDMIDMGVDEEAPAISVAVPAQMPQQQMPQNGSGGGMFSQQVQQMQAQPSAPMQPAQMQQAPQGFAQQVQAAHQQHQQQQNAQPQGWGGQPQQQMQQPQQGGWNGAPAQQMTQQPQQGGWNGAPVSNAPVQPQQMMQPPQQQMQQPQQNGWNTAPAQQPQQNPFGGAPAMAPNARPLGT